MKEATGSIQMRGVTSPVFWEQMPVEDYLKYFELDKEVSTNDSEKVHERGDDDHDKCN